MRNSAWTGAIHLGVLLLVAGMLTQVPALAEETQEQPHEEADATHEASHFHRNHFEGIIGWSHKDTSKDSVTFGMGYTRVLTRRIGINAYIELSEGQFKADTVGLNLIGYATKSLYFHAGPGLERSLFEEKEYLGRVGLGYIFRPKGVALAPAAWVDFVEGHKIYFVGVAIGKSF